MYIRSLVPILSLCLLFSLYAQNRTISDKALQPVCESISDALGNHRRILIVGFTAADESRLMKLMLEKHPDLVGREFVPNGSVEGHATAFELASDESINTAITLMDISKLMKTDPEKGPTRFQEYEEWYNTEGGLFPAVYYADHIADVPKALSRNARCFSFKPVVTHNDSRWPWWIQTLYYRYSKKSKPVTDEYWKGFVGTPPSGIRLLIDSIRKGGAVLNRALLYGPPGNGKTTIAHKIAEALGAKLIEVKASTVVNKYIGSGAAAIEEYFQQAKQWGASGPVVLFIDEIEQIARKSSSDQRAEHDAALRTLWLNLDELGDNNQFLFLGATNHYEQLNRTLLDRFGNNCFKIVNPDYRMRYSYANKLFTEQRVHLTVKFTQLFAKATVGMSMRAIKDLVSAISMRVSLESEKPVRDIVMEELAYKRSLMPKSWFARRAIEPRTFLTYLQIGGYLGASCAGAVKAYQWYRATTLN